MMRASSAASSQQAWARTCYATCFTWLLACSPLVLSVGCGICGCGSACVAGTTSDIRRQCTARNLLIIYVAQEKCHAHAMARLYCILYELGVCCGAVAAIFFLKLRACLSLAQEQQGEPVRRMHWLQGTTPLYITS